MKNLRLFFTFSFFAVCVLVAETSLVSAQETQIAKNETGKEKIISSTEETSSETKSENVSDSSEKLSVIKNNPVSRVGVQTAQTTPLTLNDAIRKALENNNEIEVSRSDVKIAETNLRSILGTYDGVFTIAPTLQRTATTGESATNDFRLNSDFTKFIRYGGGSYRVFFDNTRTENRFAQAQATQGGITSGSGGALFSSSFGVTYNQPLWRDFKIDQTRRQIKIQRKRIAQSDADFRRQTIEIISQVQQAYWDLVFALRDQQNRLANLNLSKENLRRINAQIDAGSAAPLARAEVETELANRESDLISATQQVEISENRLKQLVLRDPASTEWTTQYVPTDSPVFSTDPINLEVALKDAVENRPELRRLKLESEINKIDIDYFKNQTKPQVDLNTTASLGGISSSGISSTDSISVPLISGDPNLNANAFLLQQIRNLHPGKVDDVPIITLDPSPSFLTGGFNQSLVNLFRSDSPSFSVGVTISFPLRNQTAKANLAGARFQQERIEAQTRSQEQTVVTEVRNAVQAVESSRQRVFAARRAREFAEIQLDGERKLFDVGRSTTFLLFQRENALTNARNAEIRAETDYNKALADLQRATSTTFTANGVEVDSPMQDDQ
jgi:outer membrane protein